MRTVIMFFTKSSSLLLETSTLRPSPALVTTDAQGLNAPTIAVPAVIADEATTFMPQIGRYWPYAPFP